MNQVLERKVWEGHFRLKKQLRGEGGISAELAVERWRDGATREVSPNPRDLENHSEECRASFRKSK